MHGQEFKISTLFKNNIQNPEKVDFIEVRGFARNFHVKFCNKYKNRAKVSKCSVEKFRARRTDKMNMSRYYNNRYGVKTYNKRQESDKALEELYEEIDSIEKIVSWAAPDEEYSAEKSV